MSNPNIEYNACSDYIANTCICVDNCSEKEVEKHKYIIHRKVPPINTYAIAKQNGISPSVYSTAISIYTSKDKKKFQKVKDEKLNLNGIKPHRKEALKFVHLENRVITSTNDSSKVANVATVKNVVDIKTPAQVDAPQNINNNSNSSELQSSSLSENKSLKESDSPKLEENDHLESLLNTIDGDSEFRNVKTENYIMDTFYDGLACFQDQTLDTESIQFTHEKTFELSQEQSVDNSELLCIDEERLENGNNIVENVIKENANQMSQDATNTAHYVRRSSRKRKQIDVLDFEGSDDEVWVSKRKSKGLKQRRKCDYDNLDYIPGRSNGRVNKNQTGNLKRSYRYYDSNTADPNYSSNCHHASNTDIIFSNSCCKACIINKWNEMMMKNLIRSDTTTKQKLLQKLKQRLLGQIPGYRRPEGWLSQIIHQFATP